MTLAFFPFGVIAMAAIINYVNMHVSTFSARAGGGITATTKAKRCAAKFRQTRLCCATL